MPDLPTSPARSSLHRISSLKNFLPLSAETSTISTRGQNLPALIQSHSTGHTLSRRPSTLRSGRRDSTDSDDDLESLRHGLTMPWGSSDREERRMSIGAQILNTPQMRSQRLIGSSNPRYKWERYYKTEEELKQMKKPIRKYYERNNYLIQHYLYIDRLLDSSLPHTLIQEYNQPGLNIPATISEESPSNTASPGLLTPGGVSSNGDSSLSGTTHGSNGSQVKVKRTPKNLYKVPDEQTPLLKVDGEEPETPMSPRKDMPEWVPEEDAESDDPIVTLAIYVNLAANTTLLIMKIIVTIMTSSLSVIASLVDAALDFLSTAIVWTTTRLISRQDQYAYPVGRRRLEPIGVLVFSVIMITSFFQVALEAITRLTSDDRTVVQLTVPAVAIMTSTVIVKFLCWLWCRLIRNSSVQALAQDAMTDVVFNIFSIIFPLVGYYAHIWWLDPLGGLLLSFYVIINWSTTSITHIRNLTGAACSADERNILLYLTMRFAKTIKQIQGIQAYHAGDKLNVEVDIVLDESTTLRDSHDLGESLQYVLESVPYVDRAFVHMDYTPYNQIPTHMSQQE
ncbi:cation diffusion facilitator 10 [Zopfia rhizophila CBS 207.26]|uniref:Cation diffusion facilitator 10 n=1 Tax=Zopfia rhizophila CBS 207.26 TaxID=1314779 RepID=A0A6A6DUU6_9PEZI|nr:cation diffusion facilitator 10 [Zopfia rhizophila CBS 207.26]